MEKIIIVESPAKSKTIESYMGKDYKVISSKGHVRDLSKSGPGRMGIDIENGFTPKYVVVADKKALVKDLKKECKGKQVYLATDPDREGEAISWHLAQVLDLNLEEKNRIEFNEITKPAIKEAFKHPRTVDKNLVSSQETRRMLDRIIGFKLSSLLQKKIKSKSAGRVQSVALKLIVDLEKEIDAFIPEEYWEIKAVFEGFEAELVKQDGKKVVINNEEEANKLLALLGPDYKVSNIEKKMSTRDPKPAYITSTLQQDASTKLGFDSLKTMRLAQSLYEGKEIGNETIGIITYMRTDSDRLSDVFVSQANEYINNQFGSDYVGTGKHKAVAQSQDAHEAIRPTGILRTPNSIKSHLTKDEYKLYSMIYARALASLMVPAKFENHKIELSNNSLEFKATGSRMTFDGFLKVYSEYTDITDTLLPELNEGDLLKALEVIPSQHFTKAPARYTEAKLIKDMEEKGIGRPSTYALTMKTLKERRYVVIEDKRFVPTEQGKLTVAKLDEFFSKIINVEYTAQMEAILDEIAEGNTNWKEILGEFYNDFMPMIEKAMEEMPVIPPVETGELCPQCGSPLVIRHGRFGDFVACSGFPSCRYIKKEEKEEPVVKLDIVCPKCGVGHFVERKAKRGWNAGKTFYACDNYPTCRTIISGEILEETCPICGKRLYVNNGKKQCIDTACTFNDKE